MTAGFPVVGIHARLTHVLTAAAPERSPNAYKPEMYTEIVLDKRYHESGREAHHTAQEALDDVPDILADVEEQADAILEKPLAVLDAELS